MKGTSYNMTHLQALNEVREKVGGFIHSHSFTELPRNTKQFSNLQPSGSSQTKLFSGVSEAKDSLIAVNEKCKAMSKDRLVREVVAAPEPTCILATDQQLADASAVPLDHAMPFWVLTPHSVWGISMSLVLCIVTVV